MSETVTIKMLEDQIKEMEYMKQKCNNLIMVKLYNQVIEDATNLINRTPDHLNPQVYVRFNQIYTKLEPGDIIATNSMVSFGGPGGGELNPINGSEPGFEPEELGSGGIYYNPLHM